MNCDDETQLIAWQIGLLPVGVKVSFPNFLSIKPGIESIQLPCGTITGQFSEDMSDFKDLFWLTLIGNLLSGTFPPGFFDMSLANLNVGHNKFSGTSPARLGTLPFLQSLCVMANEFEGPLPDSLSDAQSLTHLHLGFNDFVGLTLPAFWG